jgi:tetratricopeptide (TPR) repeat protein
MAEKALKNLPNSPDVLAELLDLAAQKQQNEKAIVYAQKLIATLGKRTKSDIMPDADWARKKTAMLGRAHLVAGVILVAQTNYYRADQELRAALPLIKGDDTQTATALFSLGMANYQLGRVGLNKGQVLQGAKFSQQCAAIKSQYQDQAARNAVAMNKEASLMR